MSKGVPGQLTMVLKPDQGKFDDDQYKSVMDHVRTTRKGSIGNIMRVFRISANKADAYLSYLKEDGIIAADGRVPKNSSHPAAI